jgi:hypothetical protein
MILAHAANPDRSNFRKGHLDASKQKSQVCEANFFSGELALQQGRKDEATRLLRIAAEGCPKDSFQLTAANAEL